MMHKDMSKTEIEEAIKGKGDYIQISYLEQFLAMNPPHERRKFAYQKLAEIYDKKGMFTDAAKAYNAIALTSITFAEKINNYVKEAEFYIKAGNFHDVDNAVKKAFSEANTSQREDIKNSIREFYKKQAEAYERTNKRNHAVKIYEKMLLMNPSEETREEIKSRLLNLYERTGRLRDYFRLKKE